MDEGKDVKKDTLLSSFAEPFLTAWLKESGKANGAYLTFQHEGFRLGLGARNKNRY